MKQIFFLSCFVVLAMSFSGCDSSRQIEAPHRQADSQQTGTPSTGSDSKVDPEETPPNETSELVFGDQFPKVLAVEAVAGKNKRWRFNVTLSSPYDSPERYADAWRVLDDQGNELGIRILGHDHASEQPFTRSHTIELPDNTKVVFVEGRDQTNGWSGQRFEYELSN